MTPRNTGRLYVATTETAGDACFSDQTYRKTSQRVSTQWDGTNRLSGREQKSDTTVDTSSSQDTTIATEKLKETILSLLDVASRPNNVSRSDPSPVDIGSWMDLALDLLQSEELRVAVASWVREQMPRGSPLAASKGEILGNNKDDLSPVREIAKSFALGCPRTMMNNYRAAGLSNESIEAIQTALQNLFRRTLVDKQLPPEKNKKSRNDKNWNSIATRNPKIESRTESTQTSPTDCGPVWRFPKNQEVKCTREIGTIANVEPSDEARYIFKSYHCEEPLYEYFSTTRATQTKASESEHWSSRVDSRRSRVASQTLTMTTKRFTFRPCRGSPAMCVATAVISRATQTYRPSWEEEEDPYFPSDDMDFDIEMEPTYTVAPRRIRPPVVPYEPPEMIADEYGSSFDPDYDYSGHLYHNARMEPSFVSSGSYTQSMDFDPLYSRPSRAMSRRTRPITRGPEELRTYRVPYKRPPTVALPPASSHARSRQRAVKETPPKSSKRQAVDRGYVRAGGSIAPPRQRKKESCRSLEQNDCVSSRVSNVDARTILADITRCLVNHCNEKYPHHDIPQKGRCPLVDDYLSGILVPSATSKSKQGRSPSPCDMSEMKAARKSKQEARSVSKASRISANGDYGPQSPCTPTSVSNSHRISSSENERNYVTSCRITSKLNRSNSASRPHNLQSQSEPGRLHRLAANNASWGPVKVHITEETQTFRNAKQRHGDNAEKCSLDPVNIPRCPANQSLDIQLYPPMDDISSGLLRKSSSHSNWNARAKSPVSSKHKDDVDEIRSDLSEARAVTPPSELDDIFGGIRETTSTRSITISSSSCEDSRIYFAHDSNLGYRTTAKDSELLFSYSEKDPSLNGNSKKKIQDQSRSYRKKVAPQSPLKKRNKQDSSMKMPPVSVTETKLERGVIPKHRSPRASCHEKGRRPWRVSSPYRRMNR